MRTQLHTCDNPRHDPTSPPDAVPFHRCERFSTTVDGLGVLAVIPWAGYLMLRTMPEHEAWEGTGPRPCPTVTINRKTWRVDATVRRNDGGLNVGGAGSGWGMLIDPTSFSRGGTESAERKAKAAIAAWADKYALETMDGIGAENTRADALRHLTDTARVLADCYAEVMATLRDVDDMNGAELAKVNALPFEVKRNDQDES